MMWFSDSGLVGFKEHLCSVSIHVQGTKDEDKTRECRVRRDGLQPIIIQIEQYHLWFGCFQDHVSKLLYLQGTREQRLLTL